MKNNNFTIRFATILFFVCCFGESSSAVASLSCSEQAKESGSLAFIRDMGNSTAELDGLGDMYRKLGKSPREIETTLIYKGISKKDAKIIVKRVYIDMKNVPIMEIEDAVYQACKNGS